MRPDGDQQVAVGAVTDRRILRKVVVIATILLVVGALFYMVRLGWLSMMATEGDVPSISSVPLPEGTEVLGETKDCASGGCWANVTLRPPAGQSAVELAEQIGATSQLAIPGNLLDPRTVWVSAKPAGGMLLLTMDYWSEPYVP